METIGSKRSYELTWCMPNNDDAKHPERCCPSYHWDQEITAYDTDTASTALATNTATNSVQDGRVGVQMSAWYGAVLPADVLHANMPTSSHDGRCHLRSAASGLLSVPRMTTDYGDQWNSLPAALRLDMSLSVFRARLKTFLMT